MAAGKLSALAANLLAEAKPKLNTILYYAKVELVPPTPGEIGGIKTGIQNLITGFKTQKWKQVTVKEAFVNTCVTVEVLCWFYIGECIGKRHIVGYDV